MSYISPLRRDPMKKVKAFEQHGKNTMAKFVFCHIGETLK